MSHTTADMLSSRAITGLITGPYAKVDTRPVQRHGFKARTSDHRVASYDELCSWITALNTGGMVLLITSLASNSLKLACYGWINYAALS